MSGRIAGKITMVTGGASGLGAAIVRRFADEGAKVIVADIDASAGKEIVGEIGDAAMFVSLDVTDEEQWQEAFAQVKAEHGRLDVLVNNAGITTLGSVESLSLDDFRNMLDIDLTGVFLGCKHCIPLMKAAGGSVINMASMAGLRADADLAGYNAAKAAVGMLTKSAALHYARSKYAIRCNSVHPGATRTPILDKVLAQSDKPEALLQGWIDIHPIGRLGKSEEIAAICLYLASDESEFATGAEFVVDGGASL